MYMLICKIDEKHLIDNSFSFEFGDKIKQMISLQNTSFHCLPASHASQIDWPGNTDNGSVPEMHIRTIAD